MRRKGTRANYEAFLLCLTFDEMTGDRLYVCEEMHNLHMNDACT